MKHKGQFGPVALMITFMSFIYYIFLFPVLNDVISSHVGSMDATTAAIVKLFPAMLALAILGGMWFFVVPQQRQVPR